MTTHKSQHEDAMRFAVLGSPDAGSRAVGRTRTGATALDRRGHDGHAQNAVTLIHDRTMSR
jgi:hypothetical protein